MSEEDKTCGVTLNVSEMGLKAHNLIGLVVGPGWTRITMSFLFHYYFIIHYSLNSFCITYLSLWCGIILVLLIICIFVMIIAAWFLYKYCLCNQIHISAVVRLLGCLSVRSGPPVRLSTSGSGPHVRLPLLNGKLTENGQIIF